MSLTDESREEEQPPRPERFGRYRISGPLGRGGAATVYLALDGKTGRKVAIKALVDDSAQAKHRFLREMDFLVGIDHPNVVRLLDHDRDKCFYVMEVLEGMSLADLWSFGQSFSSDEVLRWLIDVGSGLDCIHRRGIFHRDIKPGNVILTKTGRAVIADFGIARTPQSTNLTKAGRVVGTLLYLSPEQLRGGKADSRSDLYQLGLMAYKMLTGQVPFESSDLDDMASKRVALEPPPISTVNGSVDPHLERVILHLIEIEAEDRYQSAAELLKDLARVEAKQEPAKASKKRVESTLATVLARAQAKRRPRWPRLLAVVAIGVALVIGLVLALR